MARKTVLVCDDCGHRIEDHGGATLRLTFTDQRRGVKQADLCAGCAGKLPGVPVKRRGRPARAALAG